MDWHEKCFFPNFNWGGFDTTEMSGNTLRNFIDPRSHQIVKSFRFHGETGFFGVGSFAWEPWLEIFGLGSLALHLWYWTFGLGSWALNRWLRIFLKFAVFWFLSKLWLLGLLAGVDVCIPYIWAKAQAWRVGDANAAAMPSPPPSSLWARSAPIQHIGLCGIGYGPTSRTRSLSEPRFISFAGCNGWSAPTSCGLVVLEVRRYSRTPLGIQNWVTKLNFKFAK